MKLFALLAFVSVISSASGTCPWQLPGLLSWNDAATWAPGGIPQEGDAVTIPADKKILLDGPIPRLLSLTIDGTLVWGDVDNILVETSYILVNGEFHIGSEDCRFEKNADIFLYGLSNSSQHVEGAGRKFLQAQNGSTLEIHGKDKLSWTKLVETIQPVRDGSCGYVYDSRDHTPSDRIGFHINVWDQQGVLQDSRYYRTTGTASSAAKKSKNMYNFLIDLEDNLIVAIAVFKSMGVAEDLHQPLFDEMEALGGLSIRDVEEYEPYVLVALTGTQPGQPPHAVDSLEKRGPGVSGAVETSAMLELGNLAFKARSISYNDKYFDEAIFQVMTSSAANPKLSFLHDVSTWMTGDEIVVASTDFDWRQAEVRTIVDCDDCASNQIRVAGDFVYSHYGEVTYGVDERGEVGLLSRNIRIEGELQKECYNFTSYEGLLCERYNRDTFGGHTRITYGAFARMEGVQLTHMGQQSCTAKYPLHYHFCDAVPGQYIRNNVIRDATSRCIVIHSTDYLEVSNNVCFNHLGHGIFLEDTAEVNNTVHRNLVLGTQHGSLLFTDRKEEWCDNPKLCNLLSSFWITNPSNTVTDNVAAGSDAHGMTLTFSDKPLGGSLQRQIDRGLYQFASTRYTPVQEFSGNVMHSNVEDGMWFDTRLSYGFWEDGEYFPENSKGGFSIYSPRDPPNENGTFVPTIISQLTMYKNTIRNAWMRCGNIEIIESSFADSPISYIGAMSNPETSCDVRDSIFIGETDNKGEPLLFYYKDEQFQDLPKDERPSYQFDRSFAKDRGDASLHGVAFYQGPAYIENCFFDRFTNWYFNDTAVADLGYRPVRPASAFTFHPNNEYAVVPTTGVKDVKFGYCDGVGDAFRVVNGNASTPYFKVGDGTFSVNFKDYNGNLTGLAGSHIVLNRPFFTDVGCIAKPDWGMAVCKRHYFQLVIRGDSGVLLYEYRGHYPVLISKDSHPTDVYSQSGEKGHKYLLTVNRSYTIRFNNTLGPIPTDMLIRPRYGLSFGDVVRLAICLPKDTTQFKVQSGVLGINSNSGDIVWLDNLPDLDADTTFKAFYWDQTNGYLYFKLSSPYLLNDPDHRCPGNECIDLTITRLDGTDDPASYGCSSPVSPYTVSEPEIDLTIDDPCPEYGTAEGLGAGIEAGFSPPSSGSQCV